MTTIDANIGFLGAGQMATALARGFVQAGLLTDRQIRAYDPNPAALEALRSVAPGAAIVADGRSVVEQSDVVILAVKPQVVARVLAEIKPAVEKQLFVSIAAGIRLATLCEGLGSGRVVRVMPNTPALIGEGAAGFCLAEGASNNDALLVGTLLSAVGIAFRLEEHLLDAVTGLSGSGPAFVYMMIEALADGGVQAGLARESALRLAAQTMKGAAAMVLETGEHPAVLKDRVASPGGTTIAGIAALESHRLRGALMSAVQAATERARQLGG